MNTNSTITLNSGNKMPVLGLGTWQLKGENAVQAARQALKMGYRMIDTSCDYGNQRDLGKGIKDSGCKREDIYLVTKVEEDDNSYQAVKDNLHELGVEYADLILIHRPPQTGAGEELWQGLIKAKDEGLVRDIGVSNYSIDQIDELTEASDEAPVVNQIEWTPFGHSRDMLTYCRDNDIIIQAYSPLSRQERLHDEPLLELSEQYNKTPAQIIIRWNLQNGVVPLIKASTGQHLEENLNVFNFELSDQDMQRLHSLNEQYSSLGSKPQYINH
jgi:2,5-diketo-D-gluconate reductase A